MSAKNTAWNILLRYGSAIAGVCITAAFRFYLTPVLEERTLYLVFIPAVLLSALYAGVGPGFVALALSITLAITVVAPNAQNFGSDPGDQLAVLLFLIVGIGILVLARREREEKRLRLAAERELSELNADLENRVSQRTAQLEAANKELEGFCYSIAHDLRTPMRAIAGNARILIEDYSTHLQEPIASKLLRIETAANKLGDLVEGLLIYARLAGQELSIQDVDIAELVRDAARASEKEHHCQVHLDQPESLVVRADLKMARLAINALVRNAVRYRKAGSDACLHIRGKAQFIEVEDDGIGFEMKYLDKIFMPFERLHRDEAYPGVGMGLAHVKRIVERHGGSIEAHGELGIGTKISLSFG